MGLYFVPANVQNIVQFKTHTPFSSAGCETAWKLKKYCFLQQVHYYLLNVFAFNIFVYAATLGMGYFLYGHKKANPHTRTSFLRYWKENKPSL